MILLNNSETIIAALGNNIITLWDVTTKTKITEFS